MRNIYLLFITAILLGLSASAQTWSGATTDWNTASNWTPNTVPTASSNVTIPGSLGIYPVLATDVTINSLNMAAGSKLDFKGHILNIISVSVDNVIEGATLNNSNGTTDIVINLNTGSGGNVSYLRSTIINDNITFNLSGTNTFFDANNVGNANTYNGNATFNISDGMTFYLNQGAASQFNGDLTINRTIKGAPSQLFNAGGNVTGNFKFTNSVNGSVTLGNTSNLTSITGKVDITVKPGTPDNFLLYRFKNQTTGGIINVQNSVGFDVQLDTLKVNSFSITGYRPGNNANLFNNDISGNLALADDASYSTGNVSYLRSNIIGGTSNISINGTNTFFDADGGGNGNHFKGDVSYMVTGAATLYVSHGDLSTYDGNLSISRTGAGNTVAFNSGGIIGGNFSFTNNTAGNTTLGINGQHTGIGGKVDIAITDAVPGYFQLYRLINQTTGGTISVQNSVGFDVQLDTLKVNSFSITGYRPGNNANLFNNDISGNLTLSDDASYSTGNVSYLRSNIIGGTSNITINGTNTFLDADGGGNGNHFKGDVSYTVTGTASLYVSHGDLSKYDGNLSIIRTGSGSTQAFNSGVIIGGNFSFTNSTAGNTTLGNTYQHTGVGGKVDIAINDTVPGYFQLYRLINQTTGGTINVKNSYGMDVQFDTLKVNSFSITGYRAGNNATFYNNDITGNLTLADDASYTTGNVSYLRSNIIGGTSNITINGTNTFFDADGGGTGNHFKGDVSYTVTGTASLYVSHGDLSKYDGNLSIIRTGSGSTQAFSSGGIIGGNFSFTNSTAGNTTLGNTYQHTGIGGKVDIAITDTVPGYFQLYRLINQTTGGTITVKNSYGVDVEFDTLKVNSFSITGYRGGNNANLFNNDITGNLTLSDDASYTGGNITYVRANIITGDASFTKNGTNTFFDADGGGTGNYYTGNVTYNKNGSGNMYVGLNDTTSIGGGLSLNNPSIALNLLQFAGNNDGVVQQTGTTPITIPTLVMNKGGKAKITLMDSVIVTNNLNLNSGIIATGVNSNLVLPVNMTYLGGSDSSYVDGPMLKIGNNAFTFPVGQNNAYAPISITAPGSVTDEFLAQYIHRNPQADGYDTTMKAATVKRISTSEYWILNRTAGTSNVSVTLSYDTLNRSGRVINPAELRVSRWNGTIWTDAGNGGTTGTPAMGTVISSAAITSFSPFTLASVTLQNTLPVTLVSFTATQQNGLVTLVWKAENEINFSHYEVERSNNANAFAEVLSQVARNQGSESLYSGTDQPNATGVFYYRLKMVDKDGAISYSNTVSIKISSRLSITLSPNPVRDRMIVNGLPAGSTVRIVDVSGKLVLTIVATSSTNQTIDIPKLQSGMYMLQVLKDNSMQTVSFIKD